MNEQEKKSYLESYKAAKEKGVPFFPDVIFKDTIAILVVFLILVALAYFAGAPLEERANPNDTNYTPRPEWYFLFVFQLLKYFPGQLEFVGAVLLPGLAVLLLMAWPFIEKSPKRHFLRRPIATLGALVMIGAVVTLSVLSVMETQPPQAALIIDPAAALYAKNCANCHGATIDIPPGTDLHKIIAGGTHQGMPAWGGDLSTDEIDALAGFVLSPNGSAIYNKYCVTCHKQLVQAVGNPLELKRVLDEGLDYAPHKDTQIPDWKNTLSTVERNALLNFLAAPDGQRLFAVNCSGCHGQGVAFNGSAAELRDYINKGGQHLEMPAWKGTLSESDLDTLAGFVVDPQAQPAGKTLFDKHCATCHGEKVPPAPDKESARKIISSGGAHVTMPVWGDILTPEQLDSLTQYTYDISQGTGTAAGARLYTDNCSACHGQFGEGGPNPARPNDVIPPISMAEYLKTRDDITLRNIISQGQPNLGMSAFGSTNGGPLSDEQITAIVAFIRGWEANPPVELPPEVASKPTTQPPPSGAQVFATTCARCHGANGEGGIGPTLNTQNFQTRYTDQAMFDTISNGHEATAMIAWGDILTIDQIQQLVQHIRTLKAGPISATSTPAPVGFSSDIAPIFQTNCGVCHSSQNKMGGWDSSTYDTIMKSGANSPTIIPGDPDNSILAQRIKGIAGNLMPPANKLSDAEIQMIVDWIMAGALDN